VKETRRHADFRQNACKTALNGSEGLGRRQVNWQALSGKSGWFRLAGAAIGVL